MTYFAKVLNGVVEKVIVAEASFLILLLMTLRVLGYKLIKTEVKENTMQQQVFHTMKLKMLLFHHNHSQVGL